MVEYVSLVLGALGLMFLLLEAGFRLGAPGFIQNELMDIMDFIKMFFFFASMLMGFYVIGLMALIAAENSGSTDLKSFINMGMYVWGSIVLLSIFAFALYFIWWVPMKAKEMMKREKLSQEVDL